MRATGIALVASLCVSCTDSNPSSPTAGITSISQPTFPLAVAIAITMPSVLKVGDSVQATAMAILSNGQEKLVASRWRTDATGIATVTDIGMVTGVANGVANVSVSAEGAQGTKTIRVVPNYHGQWNGSYRIDQCTPFPSQVYAQFCVGYTAGTVFPLLITFSQNDDVVTSQFIAGGLTSSSSVSALNAEGAVEIKGTNSTFPYASEFTWRLSMPTAGRMIGTISLIRTGSSGLVGGANVGGTVVSLAR